MKAILEFNLPEEKDDHNLALNGVNYYCAIEDVRNILRRYRKYEELTEPQREFLEKLSEEIYDVFIDRNID